jgi:hypothetical protein
MLFQSAFTLLESSWQKPSHLRNEHGSGLSVPSSACSQIDELLLVVDFVIQLVEVANAGCGCERDARFCEARLSLLQLSVKFVPFLVEGLAIFLILGDSVDLAGVRGHFESFLECVGIYLLQDCLESN